MNTATNTDANVEQAVPLFGIRDMPTSLRFYVDGLGFAKTHEWIDEGRLRWCWLVLGNAAVMLQEYRPGHLPNSEVGVGVSINFVCKDAIAIYRGLRSRGIKAKRPFVGNAMWVTEVVDPDGYRLYFESPTDVPEETIYAE
jgi:lactoylglutathione lyase